MVRLRLATSAALKEKRDEGSMGARRSAPAPQSSITFALISPNGLLHILVASSSSSA